MSTTPIALHPERVAGDETVVRWVVPGGTLPVGRVRAAPGALGSLFTDGTLTGGLVEHTAVWLWLAEGLSWRTVGGAVQTALRQALADPAGWTVDPAPGEVLSRVITDLLAGSAGEVVRSHGGSAQVVQGAHGEVSIELGGACEHCPAADYTLRQRLVADVLRRCPDAREVRGDGRRITLALGG